MREQDLPRRVHWLGRGLLLVSAAGVAYTAVAAYTPHPDATFWLLAALSVLLLVVALFGPARLRNLLIGIA